MLVMLKARLAYLAMPKTGTTALQAALRGHSQMIFTRDPRQIHLHAAYVERFIRPYLTAIGETKVETVCQIREPVSWLESWWKYRSTDAAAAQGKSTAGISFDIFAGEYLDGADRPYLDISRPLGFLADDSGKVLVDRIFRYEEMDHFLGFLSDRLGERVTIKRRNSSPPRPAPLSKDMRARLEAYFAPEMEIWEGGCDRDPRSAVRRLGDKAVKMVPNPFR